MILSRAYAGDTVEVHKPFRGPRDEIVPAGKRGIMSEWVNRDHRDGILRVWVWFERKTGAWCPVNNLRRKRAT